MTLAIFDLDNTLIGGDSDHLWGEYLIDKGIVDADHYRRENDRFYTEYKEGRLDILEFLSFSLKPLSQHPLDQLHAWRQEFMDTRIEGLMLPKSFDLLQSHREKGHTLMIITATNSFVTSPIAERLGVDHLIATDPEMVDGRYTGGVAGTPCFQGGKVTRLNSWLSASSENMTGSWFYSDSHNDLPLLELVENPVVVDADETLLKCAEEKGWPSISLR